MNLARVSLLAALLVTSGLGHKFLTGGSKLTDVINEDDNSVDNSDSTDDDTNTDGDVDGDASEEADADDAQPADLTTYADETTPADAAEEAATEADEDGCVGCEDTLDAKAIERSLARHRRPDPMLSMVDSLFDDLVQQRKAKPQAAPAVKGSSANSKAAPVQSEAAGEKGNEGGDKVVDAVDTAAHSGKKHGGKKKKKKGIPADEKKFMAKMATKVASHLKDSDFDSQGRAVIPSVAVAPKNEGNGNTEPSNIVHTSGKTGKPVHHAGLVEFARKHGEHGAQDSDDEDSGEATEDAGDESVNQEADEDAGGETDDDDAQDEALDF